VSGRWCVLSRYGSILWMLSVDRRRVRDQRSQGELRVILVYSEGKGCRAKLVLQVYISSRDVGACEETAKRLTAAGPGQCHAIPGDLSKYDECVRVRGEAVIRGRGALRGEHNTAWPSASQRQCRLTWFALLQLAGESHALVIYDCLPTHTRAYQQTDN
jgi:hypothetical protein